MAKKDTRSLDTRALEVTLKVNHTLNTKMGVLENERDARLMKVASMLLAFKSIKNTTQWLLRKNPMCGDLPPIDLINSEYATRCLMALIEQSKNGDCA